MRVKALPGHQLCPWGGLTQQQLAFKGNKTPVGAGGAESHGEGGAGLSASHDYVEEGAWGLPCPWEAQIPCQAQDQGNMSL